MSPDPEDPHAAEQPVYLLPSVNTVAEVVDRLTKIDDYIDRCEPRKTNDGLGSFNHLYNVITTRVLEGINDGFFADPHYMEVLDVAFANRYLDALRAGVQNPATMPRSWRVLVDRRGDDRIEGLQFAVAGVNAHINFDLAVAVDQTWRTLGTNPDDGTQRSDYEKINQIFAEEMQGLRQHFEDERAQALDSAAAPVLNMLSNWSVDAARDASWIVGEQLNMLDRFGINTRPIVERIDRLTSLAGNLILTPLI